MEMFNRLNQQQQPYIQSGYGAMGKLNTLLGLGSRPQQMPGGGGMPPVLNNGPSGPGVRVPPRLTMGPTTQGMGMPQGNPRLRNILMLRAQNGDTEAARMLEQV